MFGVLKTHEGLNSDDGGLIGVVYDTTGAGTMPLRHRGPSGSYLRI